MVDTILRNLINNAIKFSNPGLEIMTDVKHHGEFLQINVADQGVGMTKEEVENVFRIDSKVKNRGTNDEDGTGLGLVLCKEFVQINKGNIWVESKPALGSIFSFTVPAANGEWWFLAMTISGLKQECFREFFGFFFAVEYLDYF